MEGTRDQYIGNAWPGEGAFDPSGCVVVELGDVGELEPEDIGGKENEQS